MCTLQAIQQFGTRLAELQSALQRDKDTLAVLDVALQAGATSEVASSVRHVARLLSEKQDINCQVRCASVLRLFKNDVRNFRSRLSTFLFRTNNPSPPFLVFFPFSFFFSLLFVQELENSLKVSKSRNLSQIVCRIYPRRVLDFQSVRWLLAIIQCRWMG